jgi:cell division protein FtsQ
MTDPRSNDAPFFTPSRRQAGQSPEPQLEATASLDVRLLRLCTRFLMCCFALVLCGLGGLWLMTRSVFGLQHIQVKGDTGHYSANALYNHLSPVVEGNFFSQNINAVRDALEDLPWVRQASVQRVFPNAVTVQIEEHQAAALWLAASQPGRRRGVPSAEGSMSRVSAEPDRLLNEQGEIFSIETTEISAMSEVDRDSEKYLPHLRGPDAGSVQVLHTYQTLLPLLTQHGFVMQDLELSGQGLWRMQLKSGATIELGRGDAAALAQRMARFLTTWRELSRRYGLSGTGALQSADLRYPHGYAIRLKHFQNDVAQKASSVFHLAQTLLAVQPRLPRTST